MRLLTFFVFALTLITGWLSYSSNGTAAEVVKLAYAYLALMSVVCAMIMLTMKPGVSKEISPAQQEASSSVPESLSRS